LLPFLGGLPETRICDRANTGQMNLHLTDIVGQTPEVVAL